MPKLNLDNPVFRAMGRLGDLLILNLTWALCCLPVVTAGASTTALFYVARRLAAGEDCMIWLGFFHSVRLLMDALIFSVTHPACGGAAVGLALWLPLLGWYDTAAALMALEADLNSGESRVFLTDDAASFQRCTGALLYRGGRYPERGAEDWEKMTVPWEEWAGSADVELHNCDGKQLWFARRAAFSEADEAAFAGAGMLWEALWGA